MILMDLSRSFSEARIALNSTESRIPIAMTLKRGTCGQDLRLCTTARTTPYGEILIA